MAVVLTILKILGIILLIVIGLILLLVLLVLFVPVRYKVKGGYTEEYLGADVNVRWLFFRVLANYSKEGGLTARAKIAFITVYQLGGDKKTKVSKKKKGGHMELPPPEDLAGQETAVSADTPAVTSVEDITPEEAQIFGDGKPVPQTKEEKKAAKKAEKEAKKAAKQAKTEAEQKSSESGDAESKPSVMDKVEAVRNKIEVKKNHIQQFLERDTTKRTIERGKKLLKKIFRHLKPTKGHVDLTMGLGSAADTGMILGKVAMFYPLYGKWLFITPDFYYKRIEAEGDVKGRIRIGSLAIPGLIFILRKDTRRTIKLAKKI